MMKFYMAFKHDMLLRYVEMQEIKSTEDTAKARKQKIQEDEEDWTIPDYAVLICFNVLWYLYAFVTWPPRILLKQQFSVVFRLMRPVQDVQAEISKLQEDLARETDAQKKRLTEHQYEAPRCNEQSLKCDVSPWHILKLLKLHISKLCQKWSLKRNLKVKAAWSGLILDRCKGCKTSNLDFTWHILAHLGTLIHFDSLWFTTWSGQSHDLMQKLTTCEGFGWFWHVLACFGMAPKQHIAALKAPEAAACNGRKTSKDGLAAAWMRGMKRTWTLTRHSCSKGI